MINTISYRTLFYQTLVPVTTTKHHRATFFIWYRTEKKHKSRYC